MISMATKRLQGGSWLAIAGTLGRCRRRLSQGLGQGTANLDGTYAYNRSPTGARPGSRPSRTWPGSTWAFLHRQFANASKINRIIVGKDNVIMDMRGGSYTATSSAQTSLLMGVKAATSPGSRSRTARSTPTRAFSARRQNSSGAVTVSAAASGTGSAR